MKNEMRFKLNLQMFGDEENPKVEDPQPKETESKSVKEMADAITELKKNTVSKSDYEKILNENRELTRAIIDGSVVKLNDTNNEKEPDLKELGKRIFEDGLSNLEMVKRELKYREAFMKKFNKDPFAPNTTNATAFDMDRAAAVADVMQECVNECEDNPNLFTAILNERIKEDSPQMIAALAKIRAKK